MPSSFIRTRTIASITVSSGPNRYTMTFIGRATSNATRSGPLMAMVFGSTSAKITTMTVITAVAYSTPTSPNQAVKMPVASAEAPILAMLLPSSSAPIMRSRIANRLETTAASRLPCFDSRIMLAREAPVSAVSLAEKNAETSSKATTMDNVSQSVMSTSFLCQLGFQEIANQRRFDVGRNHGAADRLQQDEGEPAALDLLV